MQTLSKLRGLLVTLPLLVLLALAHAHAVHVAWLQPAHFVHRDALCQAWFDHLLAVHPHGDVLPAIRSNGACGRSRRR